MPLGPVSGVRAVTPSTPVSPAEVEGLQEWELGGVWVLEEAALEVRL